METKLLYFDKVKYMVPEPFFFLDKTIDEYPSFCGAGTGIGDKVVPENIGGMRCAHICHIHDEWWDRCDPTWIAFLRGNMAFCYNLAVYLATGTGHFCSRLWRLLKGAFYVGAVSILGWKIFKKIKGMK